MNIMNKRLIIILVIGMAICVSLASAASCTFCHDKKNHKGNDEEIDPCACLCPFEESGFCTPIPGIDIDTGDTVISDPTGTVKASFTADKTSGSVPLTVQFTDTSSGSPNIWGWDFGDGTNSALQNPTHTYTFPGNYSVTFMAKKYTKEGTQESIVTAMIIKPDYIVATGQPLSSETSTGTASASVMGSSSTPAQSPAKSDQGMGIPIILQPVITLPVTTYSVQVYYPATNPVLYLATPYSYYEYAGSVPTVAGGKPIITQTIESQVMPYSYGNYMTIPFPFLLQYPLKGILLTS
jgi:PKD repeat protein